MIKKVTISNRLNILDFFKDMKNYVIMRIDDDFPSYKYSDDIDILTNDLESIKQYIMEVGKKYTDFNIRINNGSGGKTHYHIDFLYKNETIDDFRFDVISDLNKFYKTLNIPSDYIEQVLAHKQTKNINGIKVYIPKLSNELELRYMEYKTKIDRKPKKIKHLRFIEKYPNVKFKKY